MEKRSFTTFNIFECWRSVTIPSEKSTTISPFPDIFTKTESVLVNHYQKSSKRSQKTTQRIRKKNLINMVSHPKVYENHQNHPKNPQNHPKNPQNHPKNRRFSHHLVSPAAGISPTAAHFTLTRRELRRATRAATGGLRLKSSFLAKYEKNHAYHIRFHIELSMYLLCITTKT